MRHQVKQKLLVSHHVHVSLERVGSLDGLLGRDFTRREVCHTHTTKRDGAGILSSHEAKALLGVFSTIVSRNARGALAMDDMSRIGVVDIIVHGVMPYQYRALIPKEAMP
jgi:hypothetical protein